MGIVQERNRGESACHVLEDMTRQDLLILEREEALQQESIVVSRGRSPPVHRSTLCLNGTDEWSQGAAVDPDECSVELRRPQGWDTTLESR